MSLFRARVALFYGPRNLQLANNVGFSTKTQLVAAHVTRIERTHKSRDFIYNSPHGTWHHKGCINLGLKIDVRDREGKAVPFLFCSVVRIAVSFTRSERVIIS